MEFDAFNRVAQAKKEELMQIFVMYPAHFAVVENDVEKISRLMVDSSAMNPIDWNLIGLNVLDLAIILSRTEICRICFQEYSNADNAYIHSLLALQLAFKYATAETIKLVLEYIPILDHYEPSLCWAAAANRNVFGVQLLIEKGHWTNDAWRNNNLGSHSPPLFIAIEKNNAAVVRVILEQSNVDINSICHSNQFSFSGKLVCHYAAKYADDEIVSMLIAHGASFDDRDAFGNTPVIYAAENPNEKVLQKFLDLGAVLSVYGVYSMLYKAITNPNSKILRILLDSGKFDVNENQFGQSPFEEALLYGTAAKVLMLKDAGAVCKASKVLHRRILKNNHAGIARVLIDNNIRVADCLLSAAYSGNEDAFFTFLEAGVAQLPETFENCYDDGEDEFDMVPGFERAFDLVAAAVQGQSSKIVRFLLQKYPQCSLVDIDRHVMQMSGHLYANCDMMAEMFSRGVDYSERDMRTEKEVEYFTTPLFEKVLSLVACGSAVANEASLLYKYAHRTYSRASMAILLYADDTGADNSRNLRGASDEHSYRWAAKMIAERQFYFLKRRALQVCMALHETSALEQCEILTNSFAPLRCLVPWHKVWKLVTAIKHWKD